MRLIFLLVTATLVASPLEAQPAAASPGQTPQPPANQQAAGQSQSAAPEARFDLPVSLDKIKGALEQPTRLSITTVDNRPTFRVQILERQKLEELLATLNYKAGPVPAGGVYWNELQRVMWPAVDNPLRQPYSAFSSGELLTILIENLVGKYLGGKAVESVSNAVRARAERDARTEVQQAIRDYCAAQPNSGAGIEICSTASAFIR